MDGGGKGQCRKSRKTTCEEDGLLGEARRLETLKRRDFPVGLCDKLD